MVSTPESRELQRQRPMNHASAVNRIRLAVSDLGGLSLPYTVGMFQRWQDPESRPIRIGEPGTSDTIACIRGRFVGIEVKVGNDVHRADQKSFQRAIEAAGGLYILARFTDTLDGVATLRRAVDAEANQVLR
jgi:hypothetical protein